MPTPSTSQMASQLDPRVFDQLRTLTEPVFQRLVSASHGTRMGASSRCTIPQWLSGQLALSAGCSSPEPATLSVSYAQTLTPLDDGQLSQISPTILASVRSALRRSVDAHWREIGMAFADNSVGGSTSLADLVRGSLHAARPKLRYYNFLNYIGT